MDLYTIPRLSSGGICMLLISILIAKTIFTIFYNLFFSLLAKFPGPKIAAATHWYEFCHNYYRQGRYIFVIEKMHMKYGPIVRVNPDLISIHDPEAYNEIYVGESKRKTENYPHFGQGIGFDGSHFLTTNHDLHRKRRRPLEPFFSRSGVLRLQGLLGKTMVKLEKRLLAEQGTERVLRLDNVFFAMSGDVVGKICWRQKTEYLDDPDLQSGIGFPWLARTMNEMPKTMRNWLAPQARAFDDFDTMTLESVGLAKRRRVEQGKMDIERREHGCLLDWIINSEPEKFIPDRWLGNISPEMMRNFVLFTRCPRNCLGQNLAQSELNLALAVLFRHGSPTLWLHETHETDTNHVHDFMVPLPKTWD